MRQVFRVGFRIVGIVLLVGLLAYAGTCIYGNFIAKSPEEAARPEMPDAAKAPYSLTVKNTGTVILASKYEQFGDKPGERTFVLRGYWELVGNEFRYRAGDVTLPEAIFGEITVKRRTNG